MTKSGVTQGVRRASSNPFAAAKLLLIVAGLTILICVLLAARHRRSCLEETRLGIAALQSAVEMYTEINERLPDNLNQLLEGEAAYSIVRPWQPRDAWGIPLLYTGMDGERFEIRSAGPDKLMNTGDDLTNDPTRSVLKRLQKSTPIQRKHTLP